MNAIAMIAACGLHQAHVEPDHRVTTFRGSETNDTPFYAHPTDTGIEGAIPIEWDSNAS